ncbi:hypothetical protein FB45DRAFT_874766 [Roridomyces roridus]|uniref:Uncharacterized protein n=1 Tax=Roridomyces roridus TaxID=1738132 RepID=A0AAD7FCS5_9AGAR|nr:hypothetical protein FB45DRAFT_874766 [Roridomyces roridus]
MWEKKIKPEVGWSQLRRRFAPGFEDILDVGVNMGWCDPKALLEACVVFFLHLTFRWVFIQWLQSELDSYYRVNNTAKCKDRNKMQMNGNLIRLYLPLRVGGMPHVKSML